MKLVGLTIYCNNALTSKMFYVNVLGFQIIEELLQKNIQIKSNLRNIGPNTKMFEIFDPDKYPICFINN